MVGDLVKKRAKGWVSVKAGSAGKWNEQEQIEEERAEEDREGMGMWMLTVDFQSLFRASVWRFQYC